MRVRFNFVIWHGKQSEFFRVFLKQSEFFQIVWFNSYGAIRYFRELSPVIFLRPQNIIKHALYRILALYSSNPKLNPNQNRTHVPRYLLLWNLTDVDRCALLFFSTKILSKDPYLKSFIRRVLCSYCERFSSFRRYATRPCRAPYFLTVPHSTVSTVAVNKNSPFYFSPSAVNGVMIINNK